MPWRADEILTALQAVGVREREVLTPRKTGDRLRNVAVKPVDGHDRQNFGNGERRGKLSQALLQLRVFCPGLFQHGDIGVGVFPEGEEVLIGGECSRAGGVGVITLSGSCLRGVRTRQTQTQSIPEPRRCWETGPRLLWSLD